MSQPTLLTTPMRTPLSRNADSVATVSASVEPALALLEQPDDLPPEVAARVREVASTVLGLLDRYRLDTMVSVSKAGRRTLEAQLIW